MQAVRYAYAAVAVVFVAAIAYQVFLAGLALFAGGTWQSHVDFGYLASLIPVILIPLAWFARAGRRAIWLTVVTLVAAQVQTFLPLARESLPWIAALHPLNAMIVFGAGIAVARNAIGLVRPAESPASHEVAGREAA